MVAKWPILQGYNEYIECVLAQRCRTSATGITLDARSHLARPTQARISDRQ